MFVITSQLVVEIWPKRHKRGYGRTIIATAVKISIFLNGPKSEICFQRVAYNCWKLHTCTQFFPIQCFLPIAFGPGELMHISITQARCVNWWRYVCYLLLTNIESRELTWCQLCRYRRQRMFHDDNPWSCQHRQSWHHDNCHTWYYSKHLYVYNFNLNNHIHTYK